MAVFKAALVNECVKLYKKKKVLVAVLLSLAIILVSQLVVAGIRSGLGVRGAGSGEFAILVLSVVANTILPLFTALVAIDSFSGEFSQHTMGITLTRPVSKFKLFTAKVTAIGAFILANLLILLVFSLLAGYLFNVNAAGLQAVAKIALSYLVTLLPLLVLALGIVLLANVFKSGIAVFFVSILLFIVLKLLGLAFTRYSGVLLTSLLDWYSLWQANSLPLGKIIRQLLIMLGYAMMLFTGGFYLFDKKEF